MIPPKLSTGKWKTPSRAKHLAFNRSVLLIAYTAATLCIRLRNSLSSIYYLVPDLPEKERPWVGGKSSLLSLRTFENLKKARCSRPILRKQSFRALRRPGRQEPQQEIDSGRVAEGAWRQMTPTLCSGLQRLHSACSASKIPRAAVFPFAGLKCPCIGPASQFPSGFYASDVRPVYVFKTNHNRLYSAFALYSARNLLSSAYCHRREVIARFMHACCYLYPSATRKTNSEDQDFAHRLFGAAWYTFPSCNSLTNRFVDSIRFFRIGVTILFNHEVATWQQQRWTEEIS
jgi:hypothetical protein